MKTARHLFARLCDPDHLDRAAAATVRGKRRRCDVASFLFRREEELARLQADLEAGRYQPGRPDLVAIRDPKPRLISRVPIADRAVQRHLRRMKFRRGGPMWPPWVGGGSGPATPTPPTQGGHLGPPLHDSNPPIHL